MEGKEARTKYAKHEDVKRITDKNRPWPRFLFSLTFFLTTMIFSAAR